MDEADIVAAALRAQEAAQVRQVEPEKRNRDQRGGASERENQKARQRRGDFFERTASADGDSTSDESEAKLEPEFVDGKEEASADEEPRKSIDLLA